MLKRKFIHLTSMFHSFSINSETICGDVLCNNKVHSIHCRDLPHVYIYFNIWYPTLTFTFSEPFTLIYLMLVSTRKSVNTEDFALHSY